MGFGAQGRKFMGRALLLAAKGEGKVSPNPLVGCVISKNGKIIGEGHHAVFGGPHAEANALKAAGRRASGATLYVTLEPCSEKYSGKKTPPCTPKIINAGIKRVVIAAQDPSTNVHGIEKLRKAGIKVETGLLEEEAKEQNEAFFKRVAAGMPFVVLKLAQSGNGAIGIKGRSSVRISGKEFDSYVQRLRNRYDSILVGINTVLEDDPRLTCRMNGGRNPARIVVDSRLRIPLEAKVLQKAKMEKVIIATTEQRDSKKEKKLLRMGVRVVKCGLKQVDLRNFIVRLPPLGIYSVLVEGGATIAKEVLKQKLADRLIVAVSKGKILGKNAVKSPIGKKLLSKMQKTKMGADTVYSKRYSK